MTKVTKTPPTPVCTPECPADTGAHPAEPDAPYYFSDTATGKTLTLPYDSLPHTTKRMIQPGEGLGAYECPQYQRYLIERRYHAQMRLKRKENAQAVRLDAQVAKDKALVEKLAGGLVTQFERDYRRQRAEEAAVKPPKD